MFGLRVLQTPHQGDGGVLHKLHQQLQKKKKRKKSLNYHSRCIVDMSAELEHENSEIYLWLGVKLI